MKNKQKQKFVALSAKVPETLRQEIEKKAEAEERSVSQIVFRLLSTHPQIKRAKTPQLGLNG